MAKQPAQRRSKRNNQKKGAKPGAVEYGLIITMCLIVAVVIVVLLWPAIDMVVQGLMRTPLT